MLGEILQAEGRAHTSPEATVYSEQQAWKTTRSLRDCDQGHDRAQWVELQADLQQIGKSEKELITRWGKGGNNTPGRKTSLCI